MSVPLEDRIYAQLQAHAPLAALVGTRISPGKADQGTARPYVEFSLIGAPVDYTHDGAVDIGDTPVQFDSWADDYDQARAVNRALLGAMATDSPTVDLYFLIENDGTDDYDSEMRRHRVMAQVRVWYRG